VPGINVSTFTTEFDRTEYHTQYDTTDRIDFDYLARLAEVCARMLLEADAGAADALDFAARARHLKRALRDVRHRGLDRALRNLERANGRERFTAVARGVHGLDARQAARYPHDQTADAARRLAAALRHLRRAEHGRPAR